MLGLMLSVISEGDPPTYLSRTEDMDPNSSFVDALQTIIPTLLGPIGAAVLFFHLGVKLVDNLSNRCFGDVEQLKELIIDFFSSNNLGKIKIEDSICISRLSISTKPLPSAEGSSIGCYFVRGIFQRYLKHAKGLEAEVEESRCVTRGNSACEFRVKEVKTT